MLSIENENESPIERNFYHNNENFNNFDKWDNTQKITDYSEQEPKGSSSKNIIYQNTAVKKQQPKNKIGQNHHWRKSIKKNFQSLDLKIDFLFDFGAESNVINIPTWIEIETLHSKLLPLKTSSRLSRAQGLSLTDFEKVSITLRFHSNNGTK